MTDHGMAYKSSLPVVVIKVGTSSLVNAETGVIALSRIATLVEAIADIKRRGYNVVLVSSGAVGFGRLSFSESITAKTKDLVPPFTVAQKQALAAVGQAKLLKHYDSLFASIGLNIAQVLLTYENLGNRSQYLNARNTFEALFSMDVVPIVNENDTVAVQELRFGDNDKLSAMVASMLCAKWLFIANPNTDPTARLLSVVRRLEDLDVDTSIHCSSWGTGGMASKLIAAQISTHKISSQGDKMEGNGYKSGGEAFKYSDEKDDLDKKDDASTVFLERQLKTTRRRKRWIAVLPARGTILVDTGATQAIKKHKSLFSAGVTGVKGNFPSQVGVDISDAKTGKSIARGIVNYSSTELKKLKGLNTKQQSGLLGYIGPEELIHRDNLVLYDFLDEVVSA